MLLLLLLQLFPVPQLLLQLPGAPGGGLVAVSARHTWGLKATSQSTVPMLSARFQHRAAGVALLLARHPPQVTPLRLVSRGLVAKPGVGLVPPPRHSLVRRRRPTRRRRHRQLAQLRGMQQAGADVHFVPFHGRIVRYSELF